jgi:hypothetical protein
MNEWKTHEEQLSGRITETIPQVTSEATESFKHVLKRKFKWRFRSIQGASRMRENQNTLAAMVKRK